ncbi:MAG: prepilin-type N-terminal cleavage/methylation domain-containing protein [Candidatus Saccharibacteria bacterium]|nr:prepilin-type N-terminal cleavage/methylation domain-containing protein [Rhodoferax sp.]
MRTRQHGLTLLELLLTVVIFSLVISVFSQAVFQISLFERASARSMGGWQQQWGTGYGLDDYFRGMVIAPEGKDPLVQGSASQFSAWWVEQAGAMAGRPVPVTLELRPLSASTLQARVAAEPWGLFELKDGAAPVMLARWDAAVQFEFANGAGESQATWPALNTGAVNVTDEALPAVVRVVNAQRQIMHQWVYAGATQPGLTRATSAAPFGMGATP